MAPRETYQWPLSDRVGRSKIYIAIRGKLVQVCKGNPVSVYLHRKLLKLGKGSVRGLKFSSESARASLGSKSLKSRQTFDSRHSSTANDCIGGGAIRLKRVSSPSRTV